MVEQVLTIQHAEGLHARPAKMFVQIAQDFICDIQVVYGTRKANAKSILGVLTLGANQGAQVTVRADGEDDVEAMEALANLVKNNFAGFPPE